MSDPPTVTVAAACSKRRRLDVQPIRSDLAELLRDWLEAKPSQDQVFVVMPQLTGRMIRSDLKRGGIPYADAEGRVVDFHALRHTYISRLIRYGATVKAAQVLARHSTPSLTIGRYAHADLRECKAVLEALPPNPE